MKPFGDIIDSIVPLRRALFLLLLFTQNMSAIWQQLPSP